MNTQKNIGLLLMLLLAILSSCGTEFYYPTRQNVLRFKDKGDGSMTYSVDENGFANYSLGYSITNNVAVISDFKTFNKNSSKSSVKYKIDDYLWDNELVFYKKYEDCIYPALNVGYGFGQIDRNNHDYEIDVNRQFIQPSIGYSLKYFDFAVSYRFTRVDYNVNIFNEVDLFKNQLSSINENLKDVGHRTFYFAEPAITIGVGYKNVKLRYQYVNVNKLSSGDIWYVDSNVCLSLNVIFNLNKLFRKKKTI